MGFGRNPHIAKAETAEQKARDARDAASYEQAWREAARQWERAAERENDAKRRKQYEEHAEAARNQADAGLQLDDLSSEPEAASDEPGPEAASGEPEPEAASGVPERDSADRTSDVRAIDVKHLN
jgi:hypothetical protein